MRGGTWPKPGRPKGGIRYGCKQNSGIDRPSPHPLTEAELRSLWAEVRAGFPDDELELEVHFIRALHAI